jgi:DNA-binding Lrp family transcriptional regulator
MALRAYLLVKISDNVDRETAEKALRQVEALPEVDFADPVVGSYDLVLMVETAESVGGVAETVSRFPWVKSVETLKITSSFERHRNVAA